jgi:hypothetical protein
LSGETRRQFDQSHKCSSSMAVSFADADLIGVRLDGTTVTLVDD